jgi:hypothetical protein
MKDLSGATVQSANVIDTRDYAHERIYFPIIGIVTKVYFSDDDGNRSAVPKQDHRGSQIEAEVLVVNDGTESYRIIPNVVVLPTGASGVNNFSEQIPKACTQMIDGTQFSGSFGGIDHFSLDGDWCVIQFVGGSAQQPIMTHWYPHPGNTSDAATAGTADGTVIHGVRSIKKFEGVCASIDKDGNVLLDSTEANSQITYPQGITTKKELAGGGAVQVDVKNSASMEVNFNTKKAQTNPPREQERPDTDTRVTFNKATAQIKPGQTFYLGEDTATENLVLGQKLKELMETMIDLLINHRHPTGVGPSNTVMPPESVQLITDVKNKLEEFLCLFAFTQRELP